MSTEILQLRVWLENTQQNHIPANDNSLRLEALLRPCLGVANDEAGGDTDGDVWVVGDTPVGAFSTFSKDDIAIYKQGNWHAWAPVEGLRLVVNDVRKAFLAGIWDDDPSIGGGGGVTDGNKGDITVSGSGSAWAINDDAVTYAKLQNISATQRVLARNTAGAGNAEEVTLSQLLDWLGSTANGDIIFRNGGVWTRLGIGTAGQVLTVSSGLPAWQSGGGGGLTNWTDGLNSSAPNATVPVASLTATNAATHVDAALVAKGNGATTAHVADNTSTGGNKRGQHATDFQKSRSSASSVADGNYATLSGGRNNRAQGTDSVVPGGNGNTAFGTSSYAAGLNTTVMGNYSFGFGNVAAASGESAFAFGEQTSAGGKYSGATGGKSTARNMLGAKAHASGGFGGAIGDGQHRDAWLGSKTTNATQATSTSDLGAATSSNTVALPNNAAYVVKGTICCRENATGDSSAWEFTAFIKRGANAASTAMVVACTPTLIGQDAGAAAWAVAVDADTSVGGLRCRVTGEAAHNIKWGWDIHSINEVVG